LWRQTLHECGPLSFNNYYYNNYNYSNYSYYNNNSSYYSNNTYSYPNYFFSHKSNSNNRKLCSSHYFRVCIYIPWWALSLLCHQELPRHTRLLQVLAL